MSCLTKSALGGLLALLSLAPTGLAQDREEGNSVSEFLGLSKYLELTPVTLGSTRGDESTVGLEYKYSRRIESLASGRDFDLYFESSGTFSADESRTTDRQFSHKLELNMVGIRFGDFLQGSRRHDYLRFQEVDSGLNYQRLADGDLIWSDPKLKNVRALYRSMALAGDAEAKAKIEAEAQIAFQLATGMPLTVQENGYWKEIDEVEGDWMSRWGEDWKEDARASWLSLQVDFGAESNQRSDDLQLAGGLKLYGKFEGAGSLLDNLFEGIRGYEDVASINYRNGPYMWAGYDLVDASENDTRRAITGGSDESFGRFSAGFFYRNELFNLGSVSEPEPVAAEFKWEYFSEQDAPSAVRAAGRDSTSYLSASLIFDGGVFLEYKDGSKPLDVDDSEAVSLGWRYTPTPRN